MHSPQRLFLLLALLLPPAGLAAQPPASGLASAHPAATDAGIAMLEAGGNAVDAAVAMAAALAVVEPYGSGLGGGGFFLVHLAGEGTEAGRMFVVDGREVAPMAATEDMAITADGVERSILHDGPTSAGIPGLPAALVHLSEQYGALPLADALAPAIRLAAEGFTIDEGFVKRLERRVELVRASPAAAHTFLDRGALPETGSVLVQPVLASTLRRMARAGHAGFYSGPVAERLVSGVRAAGGIWQREDLAEYSIVERTPIVATYHEAEVISAPPPSAGGVVLAIALGILERMDLARADPVTRTHLIIEALRRAYRDRAAELGDPAFTDIPLERLLSDTYISALAEGVDPDQATPSARLPDYRSGTGVPSAAPETPPGVADEEADISANTTHFSVMDAAGNRVAATLSINWWFGSGFMPPGTGVLLNNEMDDFVADPGVANAYGLVGTRANAIASGKRMLSSMSPTFVETPERSAVLGTPGGSRITSMVLLAALAVIEGRSAEAVVGAPRIHHQYLPDKLQYESAALDPEQRAALEAMGHTLVERKRGYGNMQLVIWDRVSDTVNAAADPRGAGKAAVVERAPPQ